MFVNMIKLYLHIAILFMLGTTVSAQGQSLFEASLAQAKSEVDAEIASGIDVPIPKDMAGGYTHERHKQNFFLLQKAGAIYQLTQEDKYADYVRDMLMAYADLVPTLGPHPTNRSYATGKIFLQCLNDANWLVYASQAYEAIFDRLIVDERSKLETALFRPFAEWLSVENPQFFNRVHNHSTWANAAVGMIALVMKDEELLQWALQGLPDPNIPEDSVDNDGGYIKLAGEGQAGFFAQLDHAFSPDGYFTEGPYYLRYAIYPYLIFAQSLQKHRPDLGIFAYRDSVLKKAVYGLLQQTDPQGLFFPINDAQKGMSWLSRELVLAVDMMYALDGQNPMLLSIAKKQGRVLLNDAGRMVSDDLAAGKAVPFKHQSIEFRDGADGNSGGIGILRGKSIAEQHCLLMKYAAHGMGHGHFDRLSFSLYDEGGEIIQDYASARWVNIDQKGGGRYLKENRTWAKQTIAHNTLVVDQTSQFEAKVKVADAKQLERYFFDASNDNFQVVSAKSSHAYPGIQMNRSMFLLKDEAFSNPLIIDLFQVEAAEAHQYDLPFWFQGHLISTNFEYQASLNSMQVMGQQYGYQHLWQEAIGASDTSNSQISWFRNGKFFSLATATQAGDSLIFARIGANDPQFNLRHDPAFILRRSGARSSLFVSILESHGSYSPVTEVPLQPFGQIESLEILYQDQAYSIIRFTTFKGEQWTLMFSHLNNDPSAKHEVKANGMLFQWKGTYHLISSKKTD
jgi:hypothetical protein